MLAGATAILALVLALLALAFMRKGGASPSQRAWIVGGGLVFPGVVLAALLAYGLVVGEKLLPRAGAEVVRVAAVAERWRWTFSQGAPDGTRFMTIGTLHIPANRPVDVAITTRDVIHSFWVPRLAGKLDAIPGRTNVLRIEASAPGVYEAQCAEYCGIGHSGHNFRVIAHDWSAQP